jgi:aspartyl-tRNA synthetase
MAHRRTGELRRDWTILGSEKSIREAIAFPKNQAAQDLMMGAPSPMPAKTLKDLHIAALPAEA